MATAVVVALASATYAMFDLRARVAERRMALEREARAVASTVRVSLESQAVIEARDARYRADQLQRELEAIEKKLVGPPGPDGVARPPAPPEQEALRKQQQELQTRLAAPRA